MNEQELDYSAQVDLEREDRKNLNYSAELLRHPIEPGNPGNDKIYIAARVSYEQNTWLVDVEKNTPTVALNDGIRQKFGLKRSPTVKELRNRENPLGLSLISGGSLLWVVEGGKRRLITIRRDEKAPTEKLSLTSPMGRCGELPSQTAIGESNEELIIVKKRHKNGEVRYGLLGLFEQDAQITGIIQEKLRRLAVTIMYLNKLSYELQQHGMMEESKDLKHKIEILAQIQASEDMEMLRLSECEVETKNPVQIITRIDGQEADRIDNGFCFFDDSANTLEIAQVFQFPEGLEIEEILDGDAGNMDNDDIFDPNYTVHRRGGREIVVAAPEEIGSQPKVPILNSYLETLK